MTARPSAARLPSRTTLRKYGLDEAAWRAILDAQGGGCGVCGNVPPSGTLHVEHFHVKGFAKLPPEEKRKYIRGLCCWFCNGNLLRRGCTPARLRAAADYLEAYDVRV